MRLQLDSVVTGTGITRAGDTGQAAAVGGAGAGSRRIQSDSSNADSIQISGASSVLSQESAGRAARLEQLTALVQSGSYQVSGAAVSHAIVQSAVSGAE